MTQTLIIYDDEGYILSIRSGAPNPRLPVGVPYILTTIPEGKKLVSSVGGIGVDTSVTPHQLILEDIPPTEIDLLKAQNTELMLAVAELGQTTAQKELETQLAIAELANLVVGGNE